MRARAVEAVRILNDFALDAVVGTKTLEIFDKLRSTYGYPEGIKVGFARLVYFHLILVLAKWVEFYEKYGSIIPKDCAKECKALTREIKRLQIPRFRNKYIGHIWDKDSDRPLSKKEVIRYMEAITKSDGRRFLLWINDGNDNAYPKTVVSIISEVRDRLMAQYKFGKDILKET